MTCKVGVPFGANQGATFPFRSTTMFRMLHAPFAAASPACWSRYGL